MYHLSNYRPISILPIFSKIVEKAILNRLMGYLEKCGILIKHQFGFQKIKSTEHTILELYTPFRRSQHHLVMLQC